jgi:heat shock protein HslJ
MRKLIFLILTAIVLASFIPSCSPSLAADKYWSGRRYTLVEMKEVPVQQSGTRRDAYLEFHEGEKRFSGNGGCNQVSGNYVLDKRELSFNDVISTKMSCPDIEFETLFLQLLSEVDRYEMENDDIVMKDGKKELLRFRIR